MVKALSAEEKAENRRIATENADKKKAIRQKQAEAKNKNKLTKKVAAVVVAPVAEQNVVQVEPNVPQIIPEPVVTTEMLKAELLLAKTQIETLGQENADKTATISALTVQIGQRNISIQALTDRNRMLIDMPHLPDECRKAMENPTVSTMYYCFHSMTY
jgi:hypothetical protein